MTASTLCPKCGLTHLEVCFQRIRSDLIEEIEKILPMEKDLIEVKDDNRFGCLDCYEVFNAELSDLKSALEKMKKV